MAGWLTLLAVAAALVRWIRWERTYAIFNDGPVFLGLAQKFEAGNWKEALAHPYHPLYPLLTAGVHSVVPDWESAAVSISIVCGGLAVIPLFLFVRRAFGPGEAWIAACLLAVHPLAIEFSGDVQSDGLYLALFLAGVAALWRSTADGHPGSWFLAGVLSGLAYLTRPEGIGIAVVGAGLVSIDLFTRRRTPGRCVLLGLALCVGLLIPAAPYLVALRAETGQWLVSQKKAVKQIIGIEEYTGLATGLPAQDLEAPDLSDGAPTSEPTTDPDSSAEIGSNEPNRMEAVLDFLRTAVRALRYENLILVLIGLAFLRRRPRERGWFVLSFVGLYTVILLGLALNAGYVSRRHAIPPGTLVLGYAAVGVLAVSGALARQFFRASATPSAVSVRSRAWTLGILLLVGILGLGRALTPQRVEDLAERGAAVWLREEIAPKLPVAAAKRRVAYYAGAPYEEMPDSRPDKFLLSLRKRSVRYLVVDEEKMLGQEGFQQAVASHALNRLHCHEAGGTVACVYELVSVDPSEARHERPDRRGGRDAVSP